jgi:hypothetical protein
MKTTLDTIVAQFKSNLRAVDSLLTFDEALLGYGLHTLEAVDERLKEHGFDNPRYRLDKAIGMLKGVREAESVKDLYSMMYNQCVVLEVSYFASCVRSMFTDCLMFAITADGSQARLQKESIHISLGELSDLGFDLSEHVGELVASKSDISFQDMQSIARAFSTYFGVNLERDKDVSNIVFAQACRHNVVHAGAVADARLLRQVRAAKDRTVDIHLKEGEPFCFAPSSIQEIGRSMQAYIDRLAEHLLGICKADRSNRPSEATSQ